MFAESPEPSQYSSLQGWTVKEFRKKSFVGRDSQNVFFFLEFGPTYTMTYSLFIAMSARFIRYLHEFSSLVLHKLVFVSCSRYMHWWLKSYKIVLRIFLSLLSLWEKRPCTKPAWTWRIRAYDLFLGAMIR